MVTVMVVELMQDSSGVEGLECSGTEGLEEEASTGYPGADEATG
jgi:hypothetical protein